MSHIEGRSVAIAYRWAKGAPLQQAVQDGGRLTDISARPEAQSYDACARRWVHLRKVQQIDVRAKISTGNVSDCSDLYCMTSHDQPWRGHW
jgi:hypothetical protein